jgi:hypothetical protein
MQRQRQESMSITLERVATNDRPTTAADAAGTTLHRAEADEPIARWENEGGSVEITVVEPRR